MNKVIIKDGKAILYDDRWITIGGEDEDGSGQHVLIKENGTIVAGFGKGKNVKNAFSEKRNDGTKATITKEEAQKAVSEAERKYKAAEEKRNREAELEKSRKNYKEWEQKKDSVETLEKERTKIDRMIEARRRQMQQEIEQENELLKKGVVTENVAKENNRRSAEWAESDIKKLEEERDYVDKLIKNKKNGVVEKIKPEPKAPKKNEFYGKRFEQARMQIQRDFNKKYGEAKTAAERNQLIQERDKRMNDLDKNGVAPRPAFAEKAYNEAKEKVKRFNFPTEEKAFTDSYNEAKEKLQKAKAMERKYPDDKGAQREVAYAEGLVAGYEERMKNSLVQKDYEAAKEEHRKEKEAQKKNKYSEYGGYEPPEYSGTKEEIFRQASEASKKTQAEKEKRERSEARKALKRSEVGLAEAKAKGDVKAQSFWEATRNKANNTLGNPEEGAPTKAEENLSPSEKYKRDMEKVKNRRNAEERRKEAQKLSPSEQHKLDMEKVKQRRDASEPKKTVKVEPNKVTIKSESSQKENLEKLKDEMQSAGRAYQNIKRSDYPPGREGDLKYYFASRDAKRKSGETIKAYYKAYSKYLDETQPSEKIPGTGYKKRGITRSDLLLT